MNKYFDFVYLAIGFICGLVANILVPNIFFAAVIGCTAGAVITMAILMLVNAANTKVKPV